MAVNVIQTQYDCNSLDIVRPLALIDMKTQVQRCGAYRLRKERDDVYLIEKMHKKVFNLSGD